MKLLGLILVIVVVFSMTGHAQKMPYREAVYRQTKAVNDASLQGHIEKNVDKICAAYAADAVLLPPGTAEPIQGEKAIRAYYQTGFQAGTSLKINTENIHFEVLDPSHATEVGKYSIVYKPNGAAQETVVNGTMLIVWEKTSAGDWKIIYDMWH